MPGSLAQVVKVSAAEDSHKHGNLFLSHWEHFNADVPEFKLIILNSADE